MRENLTDILEDYFNIGDSYHFVLGRTKEAFGMGTMELEDFREYDEDDVAEIAEYLSKNGVVLHRWIPVSEKLPEEGKFVLFQYAKGNKNPTLYGRNAMAVGRYEYNLFLVEGCSVKVSHWMPLPEPPKEDL